jgi:hypothetical protein
MIQLLVISSSCAGILASVLQDPAVKANAPLHQHVSNIKGEGSKRASALKSSITSATPTATTRWVGHYILCDAPIFYTTPSMLLNHVNFN